MFKPVSGETEAIGGGEGGAWKPPGGKFPVENELNGGETGL
jgi:hypothetical protein